MASDITVRTVFRMFQSARGNNPLREEGGLNIIYVKEPKPLSDGANYRAAQHNSLRRFANWLASFLTLGAFNVRTTQEISAKKTTIDASELGIVQQIIDAPLIRQENTGFGRSYALQGELTVEVGAHKFIIKQGDTGLQLSDYNQPKEAICLGFGIVELKSAVLKALSSSEGEKIKSISFKKADLRDVNLQGIEFEPAQLHELEKRDLTGATFDSDQIESGKLKEHLIGKGVNFEPRDLRATILLFPS